MSIFFAATYKDIDVAVKDYLLLNYNYAIKGHRILTIPNSHPNILFGIVRGLKDNAKEASISL